MDSSCENNARFHSSGTSFIMIYIHNVNLAANLLVHVSLVIALDADSGLNMQGSFSEGNEVHTEFFSVVNVSTTPNTLNSFTPIGHLNLSNSSPDGFSTMNLSNSSTDGFSTTVHSVDTASSVNSSSTTSGSAFTSTADWVKSTAQVQSVDNSSFELDGTSEIDSNMETTQSVISYPPQTTQFTEQKRDVKVTTVNNPEALTTRSCCSTSIAAIQEADHSLVQTVMTSTPANESQQKSNRSDTNNTDHIITSTSSWRLLNTTAAVLNPLSSTTSDLQCMINFCTIHFLFSCFRESFGYHVMIETIILTRHTMAIHFSVRPFVVGLS